MSWLRIDDAFASHPKVLKLGSDQRRWTWLKILTYTCRYRSPIVPPNIHEEVPKATPNFVQTLCEIGLIDRQDDGSYHVHDWHEYQAGDPKKALRQAKWRKGVDAPVDGLVDGDVDAPVDADVAASRAGAPARPVPSPTPTLEEQDLALEVSDVTEKPFVVFPSLEARPHDDDENRKRNEGVNYLAQPRDPADERLRPIERITASAALFEPGHILLPDDH